MPSKVLIGEGKRFTVVWDWIQADREEYRLVDGDETLLKFTTEQMPQVLLVCDLLNKFASEEISTSADVDLTRILDRGIPSHHRLIRADADHTRFVEDRFEPPFRQDIE